VSISSFNVLVVCTLYRVVGEINNSYFSTGVYCVINYSLTGFLYQEGLLLCVSVSQKNIRTLYMYIYIYICAVNHNSVGCVALHNHQFYVAGEWRSVVVLRGEAEIYPRKRMCVRERDSTIMRWEKSKACVIFELEFEAFYSSRFLADISLTSLRNAGFDICLWNHATLTGWRSFMTLGIQVFFKFVWEEKMTAISRHL
jgi:hypothetical protein